MINDKNVLGGLSAKIQVGAYYGLFSMASVSNTDKQI